MFSVAICDDDTVFCEQCKGWISDDLKIMGVEYQILVYNSIRNITYDIMDGIVFDALFLDIEFPKEDDNGVELGVNLRDILKNEYTQIVYVSSVEAYAMRLFQARPVEFLTKPLDLAKLQKTLEKIIYLQRINKKTFKYSFGSKEHRLQLGNILYFESVGRKVKIACRNQKVYSYNGRISDVYETLKENEFFSPHKSYVVNYHAVEQWSRTDLILVDGSIIPVSRNRVPEMREIQFRKEFPRHLT